MSLVLLSEFIVSSENIVSVIRKVQLCVTMVVFNCSADRVIYEKDRFRGPYEPRLHLFYYSKTGYLELNCGYYFRGIICDPSLISIRVSTPGK